MHTVVTFLLSALLGVLMVWFLWDGAAPSAHPRQMFGYGFLLGVGFMSSLGLLVILVPEWVRRWNMLRR